MGYFTATTLNELKGQYRKLAFSLHPDVGGDAKAFSDMKAEYETLFKTLKDKAFKEDPEHNKEWTWADGLDDGYMRIIDLLIHLQGVDIELCGSWLWMSGNTRAVKDQLKDYGCYYAPKKKMWYWRPSDYSCRFNHTHHSMEYIRAKYGSQKIRGLKKELEIEAS